MTANNYEGLKELTRMIEQLMDANAHAHETLNRCNEVGELQDEHAKINHLQGLVREKISTYTLYINQAIRAADELEAKEDLLALKMFDMARSCQLDAEAIVGHVTAATRVQDGWVRKHLDGIKAMLRQEKVSA
jgi:uncharacterized protein YaaN involved in tellurite resistance